MASSSNEDVRKISMNDNIRWSAGILGDKGSGGAKEARGAGGSGDIAILKTFGAIQCIAQQIRRLLPIHNGTANLQS
jgi:hypothetical protein